MNLKHILSCSLMATALAGCWNPQSKDNMPGRAGMWTGDTIRAAAINKAIVAQHMIFPYHFVSNTAELNPLGQRDLAVLAEYYRSHPGALSVRRAGTAQTLYDARVVAIMDSLKASGVSTERLTVTPDGLPGGDGISSERLVKILREPAILQGGTTGAAGGTSVSSSSSSDMTTTE